MIHGAKASCNGPKIAYLIFVDDNSLFTRATQHECTKIVYILNLYELAYEEKINYEESEVSFS